MASDCELLLVRLLLDPLLLHLLLAHWCCQQAADRANFSNSNRMMSSLNEPTAAVLAGVTATVAERGPVQGILGQTSAAGVTVARHIQPLLRISAG